MKIGSINTKAAVSSTPTERKASATSSTTKGAEPSAKVELSATAKLSASATEGFRGAAVRAAGAGVAGLVLADARGC